MTAAYKQQSYNVWHAVVPPAAPDSAGRPGFASTELQDVWQACRRKIYRANEILYREHERRSRVFLIRGGLVKMLTYLPNGHSRIVRLHTTGQWIGLERLLGQPCSHTAVAIGEVHIDDFPLGGVLRLYREDAGAFGELLWQWQRSLAQADKWISEFSTGTVKSRVARLLLYLAELKNGPHARTVELLTVHEMAEILGVTQESVSRVLASLKRDNVLRRPLRPESGAFELDAETLHQQAVG